MLVRGSSAVKDGAVQQELILIGQLLGRSGLPKINMLLVQLQPHTTSTNIFFILFYCSVPVDYCSWLVQLMSIQYLNANPDTVVQKGVELDQSQGALYIYMLIYITNAHSIAGPDCYAACALS